MFPVLQEIIFRAHTALFAQKVCSTVQDLTKQQYMVQAKSLSKGLYQSSGSFAVFMHFTGDILGDCIITTDWDTALRFCKVADPSHFPDEIEAQRECCAEVFGEYLNIAVGLTLPELGKKYGRLMQIPPCAVFGQLRMSQVASGNVDISGPTGEMRCTLSVNMTNIRQIDGFSNSSVRGAAGPA
jgi:CheY-specific phosphatase CheX